MKALWKLCWDVWEAPVGCGVSGNFITWSRLLVVDVKRSWTKPFPWLGPWSPLNSWSVVLTWSQDGSGTQGNFKLFMASSNKMSLQQIDCLFVFAGLAFSSAVNSFLKVPTPVLPSQTRLFLSCLLAFRQLHCDPGFFLDVICLHFVYLFSYLFISLLYFLIFWRLGVGAICNGYQVKFQMNTEVLNALCSTLKCVWNTDLLLLFGSKRGEFINCFLYNRHKERYLLDTPWLISSSICYR